MSQNPCVETVFPLYQLMTGLQTSSSILDTVPSETMAMLQMEFTNTLRNLDGHMDNLLCLASFARIASSTGSSARGPPPWLQKIREFFGPKRALKTLELVVLRVILACSASCNGLQVDQAAESVRLAIEICETVEPEQRDKWTASNSAKIAKLREKVSRDNINPRVQVMVCFRARPSCG